MLYTKSFLKPAKVKDGLRISVMSRHTLDDGITPDFRIVQSGYDSWSYSLAPPSKLIGDYLKRGLDFTEYSKRYLDYLRREDVSANVAILGRKALEETVTILCIEMEPDFCHRRLLAEECQRVYPQLMVRHR